MDKTEILDPIPEFQTLEDIAEFWDTHSTADYHDLTYEVQFDVNLRKRTKPVMLLPELRDTIQALAHTREVSIETLINVWLTEKILELA